MLLIAACGTNDEKIKKQIIQKKQQIAKFEQQITDLEKQLSDSTEEEDNIVVSVKKMRPESFNHYFLVYGNVNAEKYGMISPEMNGKIEKIHVEEGQRVKNNQLLVTLNTEAIEKQIAGVKTNLELATKTFKKQKALWDQEIGSEMQYLQAKSQKESLESQLESLQAQLKMAQLRAPYAGLVNKIYPKEGEMAGPGFPVIEFVNLSKMAVKANVSEKYIGEVVENQMVELTFASLPGYKKHTPIVRVSKVIDSKSRTFEIELKVDNPDEKIKPNLVSTIRINDYSNDSALIVPSLAIKKDITGDYVYVAAKKDTKTVVDKRYVELGLSYQDESMIKKGLKPGDKVIVKGYNVVSSGIPVRIK